MLIRLLICVMFYVVAALDFGMAAWDLSKKRYTWFGFGVMAGIAMSIGFIINVLKLWQVY